LGALSRHHDGHEKLPLLTRKLSYATFTSVWLNCGAFRKHVQAHGDLAHEVARALDCGKPSDARRKGHDPRSIRSQVLTTTKLLVRVFIGFVGKSPRSATCVSVSRGLSRTAWLRQKRGGFRLVKPVLFGR
jgi:hypothetical protein